MAPGGWMASSLGLRAVAEVVDTRPAAQTLLQMGCTLLPAGMILDSRIRDDADAAEEA
jgi:hypothetical protein